MLTACGGDKPEAPKAAPDQTVQGLRERGHQIEALSDSYQDFGAGQFIWRLGADGNEDAGAAAERGYLAASDPRRDGAAVGF